MDEIDFASLPEVDDAQTSPTGEVDFASLPEAPADEADFASLPEVGSQPAGVNPNAQNEPIPSPFTAFMNELGSRLLSGGGIQENAEDSWAAKPYAYANDLVNSAARGLTKIGPKIEEAVGNLLPGELGRTVTEYGRNASRYWDSQMPNQAIRTAGPDGKPSGAVDRVLQIPKNVAEVSAEFAPAAFIPGYAAAIVGTGAINAYGETRDRAKEYGLSDEDARAAGWKAGGFDLLTNMLLMGQFKGMFKGADQGLRRYLFDTAKSAGIMGAQGFGNQTLENEISGRPIYEGAGKALVYGGIEGGLFHIVNHAAHAAPRVFADKPGTTDAERMAHDPLNSLHGRMLLAQNSPDATETMVQARIEGKPVTEKMLTDIGIPASMVKDQAVRDKLADAFIADRRVVRGHMDVVLKAQEDPSVLDMAQPGLWVPKTEGVSESQKATAGILGTLFPQDGIDSVEFRDGNLVYHGKDGTRLTIAQDGSTDYTTREEMAEEHRAQTAAGMEARAERKRQEAEWRREEEARAAQEASDENRPNRTLVIDDQTVTDGYIDKDPVLSDINQRLNDTNDETERKVLQKQFDDRVQALLKKDATTTISVQKDPDAKYEPQPVADMPELPAAGKDAWPEYKGWLAETGKADSAKNWNLFVASNDLDPALKVDTKDARRYEEFRLRMEQAKSGEPEPPKRAPYDQTDAEGRAIEGRETKRAYEMELNHRWFVAEMKRRFPNLTDAEIEDRFSVARGNYDERVKAWEAKREGAEPTFAETALEEAGNPPAAKPDEKKSVNVTSVPEKTQESNANNGGRDERVDANAAPDDDVTIEGVHFNPKGALGSLRGRIEIEFRKDGFEPSREQVDNEVNRIVDSQDLDTALMRANEFSPSTQALMWVKNEWLRRHPDKKKSILERDLARAKARVEEEKDLSPGRRANGLKKLEEAQRRLDEFNAGNRQPEKPVEDGAPKETSEVPSAPAPVQERPAEPVGSEAPKTESVPKESEAVSRTETTAKESQSKNDAPKSENDERVSGANPGSVSTDTKGMSRAEVNAKFKELEERAWKLEQESNRLVDEHADAKKRESVDKELNRALMDLEQFRLDVSHDGRFKVRQTARVSRTPDGFSDYEYQTPERIYATDKATEEDYRAWLKKYKLRDTKKRRANFNAQWDQAKAAEARAERDAVKPKEEPKPVQNEEPTSVYAMKREESFNRLNDDPESFDENGNGNVRRNAVDGYSSVSSKFDTKTGGLLSRSYEKGILKDIALHSPGSIVGKKDANAEWLRGAMMALDDAGYEITTDKNGGRRIAKKAVDDSVSVIMEHAKKVRGSENADYMTPEFDKEFAARVNGLSKEDAADLAAKIRDFTEKEESLGKANGDGLDDAALAYESASDSLSDTLARLGLDDGSIRSKVESARKESVAPKAEESTPGELAMDTPVEFDVTENGRRTHVKGTFDYIDDDGMAVVTMDNGRMRKFNAADVKPVKAPATEKPKAENATSSENPARKTDSAADAATTAEQREAAKKAYAALGWQFYGMDLKQLEDALEKTRRESGPHVKPRVKNLETLIAYRKAVAPLPELEGGSYRAMKEGSSDSSDPLSNPRFLAWTERKKVRPSKESHAIWQAEEAAKATKLVRNFIPNVRFEFAKEAPKRGGAVKDESVRRMIVEDPDVIDAFDNPDGTITVFRAVQVNDKGEVRPPQSTMVRGEGEGGKIEYRPAEGYVDKDGNIRSANGGAVVIKAEERPDLAFRKIRKNGKDVKFTEEDEKAGLKPISFTQKDVEAGDATPDMIGKPKWYFDLNKAKGKTTGGVKYDPYMHTNDTPLPDQFSSAWSRPDWKVAVGRILKSDLESGYRADKAGLSVGQHEWKGGVVDNQLTSDLKRQVYLTQMVRLDRIMDEREAAKMLKEKWGELGRSLDIPDTNVTPQMRKALEAEGFKVRETGKVRYLHDDGGRTVGEFDRRTGKVTLYPGATPETVMHELGGHALRLRAEQLAKNGDRTLLDKLNKAALETPKEFWDEIGANYKGAGVDEMVDEVYSHVFGRRTSPALEKALATKEGRAWYQKVWDALKDVWRSIASKLGGNRVDLDPVKDMTPEETMDYIASQMLRGKTLGKLDMGTEEGTRRQVAAGSPSGSVDMDKSDWKRDLYMRNLADRFHDHLSLERDIESATGSQIPKTQSYYYAKRVQPGKDEAARIQVEAAHSAVADFLERSTGNVSLADLDNYLYSRFAQQRNARLMRNRGVRDGAGVSDQWARDTMQALRDSGKAQAIEGGVLGNIDAIRDASFDAVVASGLISRNEADRMRREEPDYVPLRTDYTDEDGFNRNSSRSVEAKTFKEAKGRTTEADSPTVMLLTQAMDNFARANENESRRKLANIVRMNPDLGIARIVDGRDTASTEANDKYVVAFRENGVKKYIVFPRTDRGMFLAQAARGEGVANFHGKVMKGLSIYAGMATRYSMSFSGANFIKDAAEVSLNTAATDGIPSGGRFLGTQFSNWNTMPMMKRYFRTGEISGPYADEFRLFVENGGLIGGASSEGFSDMVEGLEARQGIYSSRISRADSKLHEAFDATLWKVGEINEVVENYTRFNNFLNRLDGRKNDPEAVMEAVMASREDSTDFNMYGNQRWMNAVWQFSNSILGGTMRASRNLAMDATSGKLGLKRRAAETAAALFALGMAEEFADWAVNHSSDEEDERKGLPTGKDISEYERAQSVRLFRKGDAYVRLPFHGGPFSAIKYAGNNMARLMLGEISAKDALLNTAGEFKSFGLHFLGAGDVQADFTGDGFWKNLASSVMPTGADTVAQLMANNDYAGRPIYNDFDTKMPASSNGRQNTGPLWVGFAKWLNEKSGGDEWRKGLDMMDNPPEVYEYLVKQIGRNVVKDAAEIALTPFVNAPAWAKSGFSRDEGRTFLREMPLVNRFVKTVPENDARYQAAKRRHETEKAEFSHRPDDDRKREIVREDPNVVGKWNAKGTRRVASDVDSLIKQIAELRKNENGLIRTWTVDSHGRPKLGEPRHVELTREQKARFSAMRHRLQAEVIRIMDGRKK